jgi:peptide chain release factor
MPLPVELSPDLIALAAELKIQPEDIEERFVRGSGHGGQKINKTSSTVQLVHLPTGIEVKVQKHREQSKNRLSAWKLLILKIEEKEKGEESRLQQEAFRIRKQKQKRSKRAQAKVLDEKAKRGNVKEGRREAWDQWRNDGV